VHLQPNTSFFHKAGSLLLIVALLWLTICTPFVYRYQQQAKAEKAALVDCGAGDEDGTPLNNTNEEKAESGFSLSQEYLHDHFHYTHPESSSSIQFAHYAQDAFIAWHPEFITPPPDQRTS
jgi:hypothetical protein